MLTFTPSVKIVAHMIGKASREVSRTSSSEVKILMRRVRSRKQATARNPDEIPPSITAVQAA